MRLERARAAVRTSRRSTESALEHPVARGGLVDRATIARLRFQNDPKREYGEFMSDSTEAPTHGNKVPPVTLAFWLIKIAATTLGETAGDALSMTLKLGYAVSTVI